MNEDYILRTSEKNNITFNAGQSKDKSGIKFISTGSQLFASNNNFLFYSDYKSEKTFHVQTEHPDSGILLDNNKNKFLMNGNKGVSMDFLKLNMQVSQQSNLYFNEYVNNEFRNGLNYTISGKGVKFDFKEDKLDFVINANNGNIFFNEFKNLLIKGDNILTSCGKTSLEINKNKFEINSKSIDLLVEEKGLSISENIVLINDNDIKLITTNGNLEINNKNGEKILINNSRPNGYIELVASKYFQNIQTNNVSCKNYKIDFSENFFINSGIESNFSINSGYFNLETEESKLFGKYFTINGEKIDIIFDKIKFNDSFIIDENKFKINHNNIYFNSGKIEFQSNNILFKYGNNELILDDGIKFEIENSYFRVLKDEIKIVSEGIQGITISSQKGISLNGPIDWILNGDRVIENNKDSLKFGNNNWNIFLKGKSIVQSSDIIDRHSINFIENINDGVKWKKNNNLFQFSDKVFIHTDYCKFEIDDLIKFDNDLSNIHVNRESIFIQSNLISCKSSNSFIQIEDNAILIGNKSNILRLDDKILLEGENIFMSVGNNSINIGDEIKLDSSSYMINSERMLENIGGLDRNINTYFSKINNYYEIIKGNYELVFSGDNYIKNVNNELRIGGPNINIGGIKITDKVFIEKEKFIVNSDIINLSNKLEIKEDGIFLKVSDEHFGRIIKNEGIEFVTKLNLHLVANNSINMYCKNKILLGNEKHNIQIDKNYMEINGGLRCNGNNFSFGWTNYNIGLTEKLVYLGGEKGNLLLSDNLSILDCNDFRIRVVNMFNVISKSSNLSFENCKIDVKSLWIGDVNKILMNDDGIEVISKRMRYNGGIIIDINDNLLVEKNGNILKFWDNGLNINSKNIDWNINIDIKGEISIIPSKSLKLESTIGDIILNTQGGGILLDGVGKIVKIVSEGEYFSRSIGKHSILCNNYRLDSQQNIGINSRKESVSIEAGLDIKVQSENNISISCRERLELFSGKMEFQVGNDILLNSDKFGNIKMSKDGFELLCNMNIEMISSNPLGKIKIEHLGKGEITIGKNLELDVKGKVVAIVEDGFSLGTRGVISLIGKEEIKIDTGLINCHFGELFYEGRKCKFDVKDIDFELMNFRTRQIGFGEYRVETEGKISFINGLDGHSSRNFEINVESNSHEESIYIGSRNGGIVIEGVNIRFDGDLVINKIKPKERLIIEGDIDVNNMKLGENLFLSGRGIGSVNRDIFEMRNLDLKLDGNLLVSEIVCERLNTKKRNLEIGGDVNVNGRLEVSGIKFNGTTIGDCNEKCRDFINIKMGDEYIWNTGIKINASNKIGIDIDSSKIAVRTNGKIEVGGLDIINEYMEELEELEESDIEKIMKELEVEKTKDGRLKMVRMGKIDVMDLLVKIIAVLNKK